MKKEVGAEREICRKLQFEPVRGIKRLKFILLEYRFFSDSGEEGGALRLSLPSFLLPLPLILHIAESRALTLLKLACYFVRLQTETVGL